MYYPNSVKQRVAVPGKPSHHPRCSKKNNTPGTQGATNWTSTPFQQYSAIPQFSNQTKPVPRKRAITASFTDGFSSLYANRMPPLDGNLPYRHSDCPTEMSFQKIIRPMPRHNSYHDLAGYPSVINCTHWKMVNPTELNRRMHMSRDDLDAASQWSIRTDSSDDSTVRKKAAAHIRKWLYIVGFLDTFAVTLITTSMYLYAISLGLTKTGLGFFSSLYSILQVISSPFIGYISDCKGRKGMLTASLALTSVSYFMMAASLYAGGLPLYIASRVIAGLFKHSQLLVRTFFSDALTPAASAAAFCHYSGISDIGCILGPLTGGLASALYDGFFFFFVAAAFIFFINSAIVFLMPACHKHEPSCFDPCDLPRQTVCGMTEDYLCRDGFSCVELLDVFLLMFLTQFAVMIYRENYVVILNEKYGLGLQRANYILAYQAGLNALASSLEAHLLKCCNIDKMLFVNSIILCISMFMLAATSNMSSLLMALVPLCFSSSILRLAALELIVSRSPSTKLGLTSGYGQSVVSLARMIAGICSGILLDLDLDAPAIVGGFCSILTILLCMYLFTLHMDPRGHLPQGPPPRELTPSVMEMFFRNHFE